MSDQQVNNALLILAFILLIAGFILTLFPSFSKVQTICMTYVFVAFMIDHYSALIPKSRNDREKKFRIASLFYYQKQLAEVLN
jgi:hypothetical protein